MGKKYALRAVILVGCVLAVLAFAPRGLWAETGAFIALGILFVGALYVTAFRRFVLGHRRAVNAVGIGMLVVGIAVFSDALSPSSPLDPNISTIAAAVLVLFGILVITLPFSVRRLEADTAVLKAEKTVPHVAGGFHPVSEIKDILAELIRDRRSLARVVGPWLLLGSLLLFVLFDTDRWKGLVQRHKELAGLVALGLLALILAEIVVLFVAMIQWTRFTATKQEPRLTAFPGKALWGWFWRWIVYGAVSSSIERVHPWLKAHLAAPSQMDGVWGLIGFLVLVLISPFALVLPAVALNAADKGLVRSMGGFRLVGRKYYLGAALILAPYAVGSWALGLLSVQFKGPVVDAASLGTLGLLAVSTMVVGTTYLTRIYLRGAAAMAGATE